MQFPRQRTGLAMIAAVAAAVLIVGPALADTSIAESGKTGYHTLRDTSGTPGVDCRYRRVTPSPGGYDYEARLNTIVVKPPRVRAFAGTQKVAWMFTVFRAPYTTGFGTWSLKYTSPLQTRMTNTTTNAPFDQMSADITVPNAGHDDGPLYGYRVRILMFWYSVADKINGSSVHQVSWYRRVLRPAAWAGDSYTDAGQCYAWEYIEL